MRDRASVTVATSTEEAYRRWRELAAEASGPLRLAPLEILEEVVGRRLGWRTPAGAETEARGVVVFVAAPGDQGTELHVDLEYDVTGGQVGAAVKKLTGDEPLEQLRDDLRRFKQIVETGEVARSQGTPEGHRADRHLHQRPAQPGERVTEHETEGVPR